MAVKDLLSCPLCGHVGLSVEANPGFSFVIACFDCGRIGVYRPTVDASTWYLLSETEVAALVMEWLARRGRELQGERGVTDQLDRVAELEREIQTYRNELAQCAQIVHQAYHREAQDGWQTCLTGVCQRIRRVLGIDDN